MRVKLFTQRSSFEARVDIPLAIEELKRISAMRHCIGAIRLETWKTANRVLLNMVKEKGVVQGVFSGPVGCTIHSCDSVLA